MKKFSDLQTRKWLPSWQRKHKVDNWQTQAAAQQEGNCASCPAVAEQQRAAGAESQAAAPRSPRGHGRAVLDALQRLARATRSGVAAVIRRRGRKPEPQREVEEGREAAIAGTSTAAGPQSQDSALQSPCCPPSPFPSHRQALGGQRAGAAARAVLPVAESEDGACSEDESLWDISSLPEPSTEDENTEESWSSGEECSSVSLPCQAWAQTPWDSQAGTASVPGPGVSSTSSYTRAKAPSPHGFPDRCALSPRPSDLEARSGQWAGTAAKAVLSVAPSQDGAWSEELSDNCSLLELPPEENSRDQGWASGEKGFPVPVPREAWAEPRALQAATVRARAPVGRISSPYIRPKAPTPDARPPSPSPSQLEALSGPWTGLWTICGEWRGEEKTEQPLSPEEGSNHSELSEEDGEGVQIYTIWVKPSLLPVLLQPQTASREGPRCACLICAEAAQEDLKGNALRYPPHRDGIAVLWAQVQDAVGNTQHTGSNRKFMAALFCKVAFSVRCESNKRSSMAMLVAFASLANQHLMLASKFRACEVPIAGMSILPHVSRLWDQKLRLESQFSLNCCKFWDFNKG
ncbi:uncharacterized protein LOC114055334 [Empidonax traillii]|uniref:uncharacterized protein LOC114055334 n=1 Tax=Empidonax traillii TaxID=164674 RepID=UPI000FFDA88E|nr:uncharacterized protein LOC114055334 [Empidonax traillii]